MRESRDVNSGTQLDAFEFRVKRAFDLIIESPAGGSSTRKSLRRIQRIRKRSPALKIRRLVSRASLDTIIAQRRAPPLRSRR